MRKKSGLVFDGISKNIFSTVWEETINTNRKHKELKLKIFLNWIELLAIDRNMQRN